LLHPRCARERAEDLQEVRRMIEAGEDDIAIDELRWLVSGCPEFLDAHQLLGELAAAGGDWRLARGHFGYAFDLGLSAFGPEGWQGKLPYRLPANRGFLSAAKGLALCLKELGQTERSRDLLNRLLAFDPSDPLGVLQWLKLRTSQAPEDAAPGEESSAKERPEAGGACESSTGR
jgi:hypothetical protein